MKFSISDLLIVITICAVGVVMNSRPNVPVIMNREIRVGTTTSYGEPYRFLKVLDTSKTPSSVSDANDRNGTTQNGPDEMFFFPVTLAINIAVWAGFVAFVLFAKRVIKTRFSSSP